jgi:hypothetical protein
MKIRNSNKNYNIDSNFDFINNNNIDYNTYNTNKNLKKKKRKQYTNNVEERKEINEMKEIKEMKEINELKEMDKRNKRNKMKNNIQLEIQNTLVRTIGRFCKPFLESWLGIYYWTLHNYIIYTAAIILLFNNNIFHLILLLNIVCIDVIACIFLHDCPLTVLERRYLNTSNVDLRSFYFQNANILYNCYDRYEITLEFITNIVCLLFGKINCLILYQMYSTILV